MTPQGIRSIRGALIAVLATTGVVVLAGPSSPAAADDPPWLVTLGDSAISGEAGRWAGNTNQSSSKTDTGADAYFDNGANTAEAIPGCHRSKAAEAHIGGVNTLNLACSGARTYTQTGGNFKPGLDWFDDGTRRSQVVELRNFMAAGNDVDAVVVLIGANNYGFADIVQTCVVNWLTSPSWWKNYCHDDSSIKNRFTATAVEARTNEVAQAIANVAAALDTADADGQHSIIIQTYWSPIPLGNQIRYSESGWSRQSVGGCGVWNRDANWANDTAVVKMNYSLVEGARRSGVEHVVLDMSRSLDGHRLCEQGVGLLEEKGVNTWRDVGASDKAEWVAQIRTLTTVFGPYQIQESLHANYWGQKAMRNCLRQAFNNGTVRGGLCTPASGVNGAGEPNMTLSP